MSGIEEGRQLPLQVKVGRKDVSLTSFPEVVQGSHYFEQGAVICPDKGSYGFNQETLYADEMRTPDGTRIKVRGLAGYISTTGVHLYRDGRITPLQRRSEFGAYAKQAHKTKKPKK